MSDRRWADKAFDDFWAAYPRKVGKLAAKREWDRIRPTPAIVQQMAETLDWQVLQWRDPQYIPHPRTWLHQGRWEDEPSAPVTPETSTQLHGVEQWILKRAADK